MKTFLSILTVLYMLLASFFNGFAAPAEDSKPVDGTLPAVVLTQEEKDLLQSVFDSELAWLASTQLANGAIPMTGSKNGELNMNPYFADFAALALLEDAEQYAENVKNYMEWHFDHLNTASTDYNRVDGTIYDYTITVADGEVIEETSKNTYDSTDSYAATFLTVVNKYYEKTGDAAYILSRGEDIARIADAMLATFHTGLTFAKPDYEVKYLMDNCEVYSGVLAADELLEMIGGNGFGRKMLITKCKYATNLIAQTIEKAMWNAKAQHYDAGIFKNGKAAYDFSWDEFYPCATAQLFPILHGLLDASSARANHLYNSFCQAFDWQNFDIPSEFCWGSNVYTAAIMQDTQSVLTYMEHYAEKTAAGHAYPLYNADIARVALAANYLLTVSE